MFYSTLLTLLRIDFLQSTDSRTPPKSISSILGDFFIFQLDQKKPISDVLEQFVKILATSIQKAKFVARISRKKN